ncbi:hypothetical protein LXA43DRAFT_1098601 [Ganoderma leucocontextum]|nr:hypothetical protein LXA43DRAFT_1098601 [Ganoderma leucocontextum]
MTIIAIPPLAEALPEMRDGLNLLVVGTVFASFLIPAVILLFFFSPVTIWRTPLFILNVLAIILGLVLQIIYIYVIINTTLIRAVPSAMVITIVAMNFLVPICVQGILLVRLVGVYPPTRNTRMQNIAIYIPVVAFKIARLINASYATRDLVNHTPDSLGVIAAAQLVWGTKYVKVEWFLQLFDDMFVSGLFVHKLYVSVMARKEADIDTGHSGSGSNYSWAERIRTLYYIAVSNFVFPILFNIAEIAIIFYDPNFFHGAIVVTVNCYVTIIGVILATIWAQGSKRGKPPSGSRHHATTVLGSLEFAPRQVASHADSEMADEGEGADADADDGPSPAKAPAMRGRGEKREIEEKRVSESTSSSGAATADAEPLALPGSIDDPEARNTAGDDEKHRHHAAPSPPTSIREPDSRSVETAGDSISHAV